MMDSLRFYAVASHNLISMHFIRASYHIGISPLVLNIVALFCITFPQGRARNVGLAQCGAMARVNTAGGSLITVVTIQLIELRIS